MKFKSARPVQPQIGVLRVTSILLMISLGIAVVASYIEVKVVEHRLEKWGGGVPPGIILDDDLMLIRSADGWLHRPDCDEAAGPVEVVSGKELRNRENRVCKVCLGSGNNKKN